MDIHDLDTAYWAISNTPYNSEDLTNIRGYRADSIFVDDRSSYAVDPDMLQKLWNSYDRCEWSERHRYERYRQPWQSENDEDSLTAKLLASIRLSRTDRDDREPIKEVSEKELLALLTDN